MQDSVPQSPGLWDPHPGGSLFYILKVQVLVYYVFSGPTPSKGGP